MGINITFCIAVSQNSSSSSSNSSEDEIIKEFIKDLASSTSDNEKILQLPKLEKVIDLSSEYMNSKVKNFNAKSYLDNFLENRDRYFAEKAQKSPDR